jgi:GDP-L-fucose synthase
MVHAPIFSVADKSIWVAGHRGMVGSALVRALHKRQARVLSVDRSELDLRDQFAVERWIADHRPQVIILAAAKVGGILANSLYPADFLYDNLAIELSVVGAAARIGVEKFVFLGSTCVYPKLAPQPIKEEYLLTGALEPTNECYAIAKIAGLKLAEAYRRQHGMDFISVMPTNLYGPQDNFSLEGSHVLAALMRRAHEAKLSGKRKLIVWGTGSPRREFLHVDDLADGVLFATERYSDPLHINIGTGEDLTIRELAEQIADVVGFCGAIEFDPTKPDGTPVKRSDVTRVTALGWRARIGLRDGLRSTYAWFLEHLAELRR